ncbi:MAG: hypothetical protein LLG37_08105 [Spirochaetia bacterium]|nr:hypothetical protein [Spirochaetia bacterium]
MAKKRAVRKIKESVRPQVVQPAKADGMVKIVIIAAVMVVSAAAIGFAYAGARDYAKKEAAGKEAAPAALTPAPVSTAVPTPAPKPAHANSIPAKYRYLFKQVKTKEEIPRIHLEDAKYLIDSGKALFIDARGKGEYNESHIPGAICMPVGEAAGLIPQMKETLAGKILVPYCHGVSCNLSVKVADSLYDAGYRKIVIFFGGWPEWTAANMPVERPNVPDRYKKLLNRPDAAAGIQDITAEEAKFLYDNMMANFFDVDTAEAFENIHLDRAISIPLSTLDAGMVNYGGYIDQKPAVVYSHDDGQTARIAVEKMFNAGHKKVLCFKGGVKQWEAAGYPLNRK